MKMTLVIVVAIALAMATTVRADDKQSPDADMAARIAAAEAKLKAKSAAATQPITTDDPAALRAIIQDQKQQIEALKEHVAALTQKLSATNRDATVAQEPPPEDERKVVVSERDFKALPVFTKKFSPTVGPINYSAIGTWAADGTPMGLTRTELNAVGYVTSVDGVNIIDESTAIVQIELYDSTTDLPIANATRQMILEGFATSGQADSNPWKIDRWLKLVSTQQYNGTTYFVAHQIVQADRTHRIPRRLPASTAAPAQGQATNDSTSTPRSSIPSIDGVWQEAPGILVTVTQDDGQFKAECSYTHAQALA